MYRFLLLFLCSLPSTALAQINMIGQDVVLKVGDTEVFNLDSTGVLALPAALVVSTTVLPTCDSSSEGQLSYIHGSGTTKLSLCTGSSIRSKTVKMVAPTLPPPTLPGGGPEPMPGGGAEF